VGVGFDCLGHAFPALGDRVTAIAEARAGVRLRLAPGVTSELPLDPESNTAGRAAQRVLDRAGASWGVALVLDKAIPVASGLGGSAASSVAATMAVNGLLEVSLDSGALLDCALEGEAAATGARVTDNVAASMLGGLVFSADGDPPLARRLPVPAELFCSLVYPSLRIDTQQSRGGLSSTVELGAAVIQSSNLAGVLIACQTGEWTLMARFLRDVMIEPQRCKQVPGFARVKEAAIATGALGCSLSGSGPSMFAWSRGMRVAEQVRVAMQSVFTDLGIENQGWVCPVASKGAEIVERE